MSMSVPSPFYAAARKVIAARVRYEIAKRKAATSGCGQPSGLYRNLGDTPGETGVVYVNGEFHSVHPPGSNRQNEKALAGGPEVKPGEAATYSSEGDAEVVVTASVTSGHTPGTANCSGAAASQPVVAAPPKINKNARSFDAPGVAVRKSIPML